MVVEESWVLRLATNLLGYATLIIPGALFIYLIKKTKYLERSEKGCLNSFLNFCLVGHEPESSNTDSLDPSSSKASKSQGKSPLSNSVLRLLFCFAGLQLSYLTWGVVQEKIMTQKYSNGATSSKFTDSQFLVFVNRILAFTLSGFYLLVTSQPRHNAPLYKYSYCSFSNIMSSWCQYEALKYVSFPTQVLAKSSKVIPVMLMGKLVSKKSYHSHQYLTAILISVGMTLFLLSNDDNKSRSTTSYTTFSGLLILASYIAFDSFTTNWQNEIFDRYQVTYVQMMCAVNFFSFILTGMSLLQQGGLLASFLFMLEYPDFERDCLLLSLCSALGNLFIFYTISSFGPFVFTIIMTIRQAIAIILSCIFYGHAISLPAGLGIFIIFAAIFFNSYFNQRLKHLKRDATLPTKNPSDQHKV